jgi:uncharacterized protein
VLILLPPSESKRPPRRRGRPVDLDALSFPELSRVRENILAALVRTNALPDALDRLRLGPSLADQAAWNEQLEVLPARPLLEVYDGVLYDALDFATLSTAAKRRAASRLVIVSGLWGALRPPDRIPPYRLNVSARLDGIGPLEPMWREVMGPVLAAAAGPRGVVVDCRSSSYLAMGRPSDLADRTVDVRVLRDDAGRRSVVSHMAKHTRGLVARHLLESGADPHTPEALAEALAERWTVELDGPTRAGRAWTVSVVLQP